MYWICTSQEPKEVNVTDEYFPVLLLHVERKNSPGKNSCLLPSPTPISFYPWVQWLFSYASRRRSAFLPFWDLKSIGWEHSICSGDMCALWNSPVWGSIQLRRRGTLANPLGLPKTLLQTALPFVNELFWIPSAWVSQLFLNSGKKRRGVIYWKLSNPNIKHC